MIEVMQQPAKLLVTGFSASDEQAAESLSVTARKEEVQTQLGMLECHYTALVFHEEGEVLSWRVQLTGNDKALTLELEEFHCENKGAFAYRILVNGQDVMLRTYEPLVKAKCNFFVEIPPELITQSEITITLEYCGGCAVGVLRGWLYRNIDENAGAYGLDEPMQVNEFVGEHSDWVEEIPQKYSKHKSCFLGATYHIPYLSMTTHGMKAMIDRDLEAAEKSNLPVHWMLSHWWAGTAYSPDGKGGYFGDLQYGQLCYDQMTGIEHPTTPNMWGNTLWPTMNHPYAEHIYNTKIFNATEYINRRMSNSVCRKLSEPSFIMEWGSGYWFFNNRDGGDFHDNVVSAAAKDGVTLSPQNGIGEAEKEWLFQDNARYHDEQIKYYRRALKHTPIEIRKDRNCLPDCQYANNIYTHTVQAVLYPSLDDRNPAWLSGMGRQMWASSEMYAFTDRRHYEYGYSNTRLGCANLEITMLSKEMLNRYMTEAYAYGMDYVTMFNPDRVGEDAALCALDTAADQPAEPARLYRRVLLDVDVLRDYRVGLEKELSLCLHRLSISPDGYLFGKENDAYVQIKLTLQDDAAVWIECEALTQDSNDLRMEYSFEGGAFQKADFVSASAPLDWFNKNSLLTYRIANASAGQIEIRLCPCNNAVTIKTIKISSDWKQQVPALAPLTARQERIRHRLVQKRLSAERLLAEYQGSDGKAEVVQKAQNMLGKAKYQEAIRYLSGKISLLLPISYSVIGGGKLESTSFSVELPTEKAHCFITLEEITGDRQHKFSVLAETETWLKWKACDGRWRIKQDNSKLSFLPDENGEKEWDIVVRPQRKKLPRELDGICKGIRDQSLLVEVHPFEYGECADFIVVPIAEGCIFRRRRAGMAEWEQRLSEVGDAVHIAINEAGKIISCESEYAVCAGELLRYYPPSFHGEQHNGLIEMKNGQLFEISYNRNYTRLEKERTKKMSLELTLEEIAEWFHEGDSLEISYAPYTYGAGKLRAQVVRWKNI